MKGNKTMDMEEIIALVEKAKNGDQSAIAQLYEATSKAVYFTALKIVGNPSDAEDIAQDTYVTAISKLSDLKDNATFPKWIKTIAANTAKNYMTKKKPMLFNTDEDEEATLGSIPEDSDEFIPDQAADKKETCRLVSEMIDSLPEKQRAALIMFYYDEMTISEIAKAMGTNDNTIKSRLNYARKYIKDEVEALAKKGTKLYGIAGIPLIAFVLRNLAADTAVPAGIVAKVTAATAATTTAAATATTATATATATATTAAASTSATGVALGTAAKVAIAAVASVAVIGGGVAVANVVSEPAVFKAEAGTPSELELMLEDYLFGDGELDTKYFGYVEELEIYGEYVAVNRDINERFGYEETIVYIGGDEWGFMTKEGHNEIASYPYGDLKEIDFVSDMKNLNVLEIRCNSVYNIEPVKELKKLNELDLYVNKVKDISAVSNLKNLETLSLGNNEISDISPLEELKGLKNLYLSCLNKISDLSPLNNLKNLEKLSVGCGSTLDISYLKGLKKLTYLDLHDCKIDDIDVLTNLKKLESLTVKGTGISKADVEELRAALPDCEIIADDYDYEYEDVIAEVESVVTTTVTTTTATTTTPETTTTEPEEPPIPERDMSFTNEAAEKMIYDYLNNGGELDYEKLYWLKRLEICGNGIVKAYFDDTDEPYVAASVTGIDTSIYGNKHFDYNGKEYKFGTLKNLNMLKNMPNLESLTVICSNVSDLSALAEAKNLTYLNICFNSFRDISALANLKNLETLNIKSNRLENISILTEMDSLKTLNMGGCRLGTNSISVISQMTNIEALYLADNSISNPSGLSSMTNLQELNLSDNDIEDISWLSSLTSLKSLTLSYNNITDLSALAPLTKLETLNLSKNEKLNNISAVSNLTELKTLNIYSTSVFDIAPVSSLSKLEDFRLRLCVLNKNEFNISPLSGKTNMKKLIIEHVNLRDISALSQMKQLTYLSLNNTKVQSFAPLAPLAELTYLDITDNVGSIDLRPLASLTKLKTFYAQKIMTENYKYLSDISFMSGMTEMENINISYNSVKDISAMAGMKKLKCLDLNFNGYSLKDFSYLNGANEMTEINLNRTGVTDISFMAGMTKLKVVVLSETNVSDITPLGNSPYITRLDLSWTEVSDVSPLYNLKASGNIQLSASKVSNADGEALEKALPSYWIVH